MIGSIVTIIEKEVKFMTFEIIFDFLKTNPHRKSTQMDKKLIKIA